MLYAFEGDVRSGKTLRATIKAFKYARRFPNRTIYSNYKLNEKFFPTFKLLKPEMLFQINEPCLVLIDEIYAWIESRTSGKDINRYMGYILFQSGKRGMDFIITYQLESTFDLRYREMINFRTDCIKIIRNQKKDAGNVENIIGFLYSEKRVSRYGEYKPKRYFLPIRRAIKYFQMYNTLELIDPIDKTLIMNITVDQTDNIKDIDKRVKELLKIAPAETYTRIILSDYCLREDLPKKYGDAIYAAIKASTIPNLKSKKIYKSK